MTSKDNKRFPASARKRFADLVLRYVYQSGGRDRFVPLVEIEEELGLEPELILQICRTRLLGEIQIAERLPAELEESVEFHTPVERQLIRNYFAQPHLRVRPDLVRLTADELARRPKKKDKKRRKSRT
ncbi:MAG: hypothetical protein ACYS0E_19065 [Planctomycetota bacterium]|jgi:hypothetical protein